MDNAYHYFNHVIWSPDSKKFFFLHLWLGKSGQRYARAFIWNNELKEYKLSSLKQNEIFSEGIIKRIFLMKNDEVDLITDSTLTKNFLILVSSAFNPLIQNSEKFLVLSANKSID